LSSGKSHKQWAEPVYFLGLPFQDQIRTSGLPCMLLLSVFVLSIWLTELDVASFKCSLPRFQSLLSHRASFRKPMDQIVLSEEIYSTRKRNLRRYFLAVRPALDGVISLQDIRHRRLLCEVSPEQSSPECRASSIENVRSFRVYTEALHCISMSHQIWNRLSFDGLTRLQSSYVYKIVWRSSCWMPGISLELWAGVCWNCSFYKLSLLP